MNRISHNRQEAEFDMNFKIPRRNLHDNPAGQNYALEHRSLDNAYDQWEPNNQRYGVGGPSRPLQPSGFRGPPRSDYDDLPQFDADALHCYQTSHFQNNESGFPSHQNSPHANQQPFFNYGINPLKRPREVPKNSSNGVRHGDAFPHVGDPSLPKELTEQFQPLFCKLCNAQLSSNSMAKLHYKSKNHEKKIRKFLVDYAERTGEPLHERAQIGTSKKNKPEEDNDPKYFHCDVCDLPLTGRLHAESHYMGKNHQKALVGKAPAGKGHYNDEGKWVRISSTPAAVPSERDNFGLDFAGLPTEFSSTRDLKSQKLHCEMCDVKVTSEQQMTLHLSGLKHKKRAQQLQPNDVVEENVEGDPENNILSTLSSNNVPSGDLSVYRTPTGYYYCNPCNLTLNSEIQFKQHLGSKKHRKKANGSKE